MDRIEDRRGEFPPDDPQRRALHDEVHARPPARIVTPDFVAAAAKPSTRLCQPPSR